MRLIHALPRAAQFSDDFVIGFGEGEAAAFEKVKVYKPAVLSSLLYFL